MQASTRTVLYLRCSSEEQAASGLGLEAQERKGRAYCEANDLTLVHVVSDPGFSGKSLQRPGIQQVLELARRRQIDAVVILRLDRLSRSVKDALTTIDVFKRHHVQLHSVTERIDTGSASGQFVTTLLSALAELERGLISERTSAALQSKRLRGERAGQIPFGFTIGADGRTLVEVPEQQQAIGLIRDLHGQGYSLRAICGELSRAGFEPAGKQWHPTTVNRVIQYGQVTHA